MPEMPSRGAPWVLELDQERLVFEYLPRTLGSLRLQVLRAIREPPLREELEKCHPFGFIVREEERPRGTLEEQFPDSAWRSGPSRRKVGGTVVAVEGHRSALENELSALTHGVQEEAPSSCRAFGTHCSLSVFRVVLGSQQWQDKALSATTCLSPQPGRSPHLCARRGTGAGLGQGRPGGAGGAGPPRLLPLPSCPQPSPPRDARAHNGGSSGRGNISSSCSGSSRSGPAPPRAPGPRAPTPPLRLPGASGAPAARLTLKFLAVLLAAGMLAFLGAVICIIASVPLAASRARALPGGADNASAASGAAAASPGPQRSLSALHGAGSSAGPPALPGAPAASAHPLPPVPLFSRFLCTPLAAACPSGGEQGDAALGEREELLLLQSTADQLRQTALQQEARIRADQDTIRELTGKLGRCESGLPRGLQDAGPRRDTMADGPRDSPALLLELEDAVRALRDRIDRIEQQELPAHVNFSAAPAPAPAVPTALHSKMDELEGQLLAKVLALEKERVALSHSSHRQRQEVEKELDALHDRVAELEHGSSAYSPPDAFKISIPIRNNYMYARVRKALPELYAFTVCVWLRSRSGGTGQGTPFSYSVPGQANEIVLLEAGHDPMELLINDKVAQLPLSLKDNSWHHICIAWTTRDGLWSAYQDGELRGSGENLAAWHPIKPHGILILGQEQDTLGGRFDATQAFVGDIAQFNLWDHALTPAQVLGIANCTAPLLGNVLPWGDKLVEAFGGATKAAFDVCKGRAKA
ncbi:neuronal pentraxin receptor [Sturnira hondurensis]|uniref:neuronal pentraxin receptor n=1 Tax=Sturnira hondurensis TaxID=192404 RepID=UPI0018797E39|nr:neuronal pentraxin receptor [Sturnira hondurensis]